MSMIDYLAWIANLGVVPLFLFLAFLLAPAAFFLLALLIDVTAVLETMVILLPNHIYHLKNYLLHLRALKVANIPQCVKIFIPIFLSLSLGIEVRAENNFTIPIGEEIELPIGHIASYEIKDPNYLEASYRPQEKLLKIVARKPCKTEILIKTNENGLTKERLIHIVASDKSFIQDKGRYQKFRELYLTKKGADAADALQSHKGFKEELHPKLKREIWQEIHKIFYQSNYREVNCAFESIFLQCFHRYQTTEFLNLQKELKKKFIVQFIHVAQNIHQKNFIIKLKLISMENSDGLDLHLGLDELSGSLSDFFHFPLKDIVGKNSVLLNKNQTEINLLGEPVFTTILNQENTFSIGQEIPFRTKSENGRSSIQFRFAGLSLKMKLQESGENYKIDYATELTKPEAFGEDITISGNKQNGAIVIKSEEVLKVFEIEFQTDQKNRSLFPGLSAIPILGELFTSRSNRTSRKKIIGLITLKETL